MSVYEARTETSGTIPSIDGSLAGFAPSSDDVGFVAMYPGLVTMDDDLPKSLLSSQQKFDNPVLRITVMRAE